MLSRVAVVIKYFVHLIILIVRCFWKYKSAAVCIKLWMKIHQFNLFNWLQFLLWMEAIQFKHYSTLLFFLMLIKENSRLFLLPLKKKIKNLIPLSGTIAMLISVTYLLILQVPFRDWLHLLQKIIFCLAMDLFTDLLYWNFN